MDELAATVEVVPGTPDVLGARIGQQIEATSLLWADPPGEEVGFILHFHEGSVGIANVADELTFPAWPDALWSKWEIFPLS